MSEKHISLIPKIAIVCLLLIIDCSLISCQSKEELRKEQMIINGRELYVVHCANCHQENGSGLGDLYPPIANSDYLKNKERIICMIRYGASGDMVVNGKTYNQAMPANRDLYDLDIASIMTFIYNEWGDETVATSADSVHEVLENCEKP
ncbi:MAG: cytochrome c551 [Spirosomataceae bacterium]|jgi:mono/diheme cytochrome c family protein